MSVSQLLRTVVAGEPVDAVLLEDVLGLAMTGDADPVALAGLLSALACREPQAEWLVAGARAMRAHGIACGTGGDGSGTFNVSTASAFVVAASGCAVAKHGNRGVSSPVGSADVLEAAGVQLEQTPQRACELLDAVGFAFLFAPSFHPAMRHVAPIRRALGVRTLFNLLGPLCSPARAEFQLVGVYSSKLTRIVAEALLQLGSLGALVVHCDGVDEIGLHAVTVAHQVKDGQVHEVRIDPRELGMSFCGLDKLQGGDDKHANALMLREALRGEGVERSDIVALNAGAALLVANQVTTLQEGLAAARDVMRSGGAERVLDRYITSSQDQPQVAS